MNYCELDGMDRKDLPPKAPMSIGSIEMLFHQKVEDQLR